MTLEKFYTFSQNSEYLYGVIAHLLIKIIIMIKLNSLTFFIAILLSLSVSVFAQEPEVEMVPADVDETIYVDTDKSVINWKAYKVAGEHYGTLKIKEGVFVFNNNKLVQGTFTFDMTSIQSTDLQGEWADKLNGHLKSPDFFGVEAHPTATFTITKVASRGAEGDYKITGDLTIKGITKEIKFNALMEGPSATASLVLDRTDFDIKYGSGSFFDDLGDKTIYDEFDLDLSIQLK